MLTWFSMDLRFLMMISYCFSLQCETLGSSIGNFANFSQSLEIANDFYADINPFQKVNSKYFYIERSRALNWFEALHKCRELGSDLVNFRNDRELDAVIPELSKKRCYWLSINNFSEKSQYISITNGRPPSFARWGRGEPNNLKNKEHCGQLVAFNRNTFYYNDNQCIRRCYYICETKLPSQTNVVIW
ncbi:C-type lectin 37Db-like [Drosophila hydei]|uniref:C-type lectin 37Db-like n=1 Tax=Drosophila hydei TaxID=7224 RepID=A0A6J1LZV4_DROHY|nr:C-type lectin 37Db-like [Drosophila hydei]